MSFQQEVTTVTALQNVIYTTKPEPQIEQDLIRAKFSNKSDVGDGWYSSEPDCNEVFPNIFIGDVCAAKNKDYLKYMGVTHVLNTAEGGRFGMVDTDDGFYKDAGITYKGFQMLDLPQTNISQHFYEAADFIESALMSGGKILVNCLMGMSRSSTCVLAYLIIKVQLPAKEALRTIRKKRDVRPNDGFLRQLAELDNTLRKEREASHL